tara:strand:+ start:92431 stop:93255 length:825 start_codon:yes stop_codon:yes gene_type:complete
MIYNNDEQISRLHRALHKVAARKHGETQGVALEKVAQAAFCDELSNIDPDFEKVAFGWLDVALTAAMFVPGLNVVAGLARGAAVAYRGIQAARAVNTAVKGLSAASKVRNYARGLRGVTHVGKGLKGTSQTAQKFRAMANPAKPRQMNLFGQQGTQAATRGTASNAQRELGKQLGTLQRKTQRGNRFTRMLGQNQSNIRASQAQQGFKHSIKRSLKGQASVPGSAAAFGANAYFGGWDATKRLMDGTSGKTMGQGGPGYGAKGLSTMKNLNRAG